jgi:hypothetical protein
MLHKNVMQFSPVEHQEFGVIIFSIFGQALSKNGVGSKRPKIEKLNFLNIKKHFFGKNADILVCNQILRFLRYFLNGNFPLEKQISELLILKLAFFKKNIRFVDFLDKFSSKKLRSCSIFRSNLHQYHIFP